MNRKILGNSFFMGLHLTGISRLRRAPGRQVTQAEDYTEPHRAMGQGLCPFCRQSSIHTSQDPSLLQSCVISLQDKQSSPCRASFCPPRPLPGTSCSSREQGPTVCTQGSLRARQRSRPCDLQRGQSGAELLTHQEPGLQS